MSSRISFFVLFFLLASLFLVSSASPIAEAQVAEVGKRGCSRYACKFVDPAAESESASETAIETPESEPAVTAESSVEVEATPSAPAVAAAAVSSTPSPAPQNSGALFNANTPAFSCFVVLGATASIFTFVL